MEDYMKEISVLGSRHEELLTFCSNYDAIYIYGTQWVSFAIAKLLICKNVCVKGFIIEDGYKAEEYEGYPTVSSHDLALDPVKDGIVIAILRDKSTEKDIKAIKENLAQCGFQANVYAQTIYTKLSARKPLPQITRTDNSGGGYFSRNSTLDNIGLETGTDKASSTLNYLCKYEYFLSKFRNDEFTLIELGVFKGASIDMWSKYFKKAAVVGVDYDKKCLQYAGGNKKVIITDLSEIDNLKKLCRLNPTIVIDDASHIWSHQIKALFTLFESLTHGGVYILEDIITSFWSGSGYEDTSVSPYAICSQIAEAVASGTVPEADNAFTDKIETIAAQTDMISFICGSCILIKK